MITLPNGCSRSNFYVNPTNWNTDPQKLSQKEITTLLKKEWRIDYRFYDPAFKGTDLWGDQIPVKGLNKYSELKDRQEFTATTLAELEQWLNEGYNPITKKIVRPEVHDIDSDTHFSTALKEAHTKLKCAQGTKDDIERALVHMQKAIRALNLARTPVGEIKIRECIILLDKVRDMKHKQRDRDITALHAEFRAGKINKNKYTKELVKLQRYKFGASSFNHYRSYLIMLFNIIVPMANMAGNPADNIIKEKEIKKIRDVLTDEQRKLVNDYLCKHYYDYWVFLNIFFHSGARITEMLRVKPDDVDLKNQRFKALILKGTQYEEVWKVIKTVALPYWEEAMKAAKALQAKADGRPVYLFSKNQKPGFTIINEEQIGRRWRERVKHKPALGNVTADWYALKHLNSTETRTIAGAQAAAAQNSHKSEAMVVNIYDVDRDKRKLEELNRLKEVNNPFA